MSDNASSADNQQETSRDREGSSETTRQTPFTQSAIKAYLNGAIHDATLNKKTRIRFAQKDRRWLVCLQALLKRIEYRSWIYREGKRRNVFVLETTCKKLDFKFDPKRLSTREDKICYVRGFFDAEGGMPHTKDRFYIQLVQKDRGKIIKIKNILRDLGIMCGVVHNPSKRVDPHYWRIYVRTHDHKKFARTISSWHSTKRRILHKRMKI